MQFFGGGHNFVTDADHIPGRNYLSGTAPASVQGQNIVAQIIATYALTDKSLSNQVVTFNMTITSDTTSGRLYVGSSPNWQVYTYSDIQKGINKIQFTTKLNSDVDAIAITIDNSTANLVVQDATLNKGNFAREYSPAPEDFAKKKDIANPNLITGSKDFTGNKWVNIPENVQKDKYLDFTAIHVNWAWNGISQYIAVNKGETFTASMYVKAPAGPSVSWFINLSSDETGYKKVDTNPSSTTITATGDWQRTSITFTVTGDSGVITPRMEAGGSDGFWIAGMKLERGTHATPWCPAYEDYAMKSDLEALKAEIDHLKQNK